MHRAPSAVRLAAIAAIAAVSAACGTTHVVDTQATASASVETRVRTPLVDDDGWPMPADLTPQSAHAGAPAETSR